MAWYNDNWSYRKRINLSANKISGSHVDFPILWHSDSDDDLSSHASSNGHDIIFTDSDEVSRIHSEIENYSSGSGNIWVRVPSLTHNTSKNIYLYYGNLEGGNQEDIAGYKPSGVWDDNYVMVQHMYDNTTSNIIDSTSNSNDGTKKASNNPVEISGKIGKGQNFSSDHINCGNIGTPTIYTIESWIKPDALGGSGDLNTYGNTILSNSDRYACWLTVGKGGGTEVTLRAFSTSVTGHNSTGANLNTNDWFYIVVVATKGDIAKTYVNGIGKDSFNANDNAWAGNFTIGDLRPTRAIYFDGIIDEVRISNLIRNIGWIKTSYNTQNSPSTFYNMYSEESKVTTHPIKIIKTQGNRLQTNPSNNNYIIVTNG